MNNKAHYTIPAELDQLETIGGWVAEIIVNVTEATDFVYLVQLAVHELCVNVIEHAYDNQGGIIDLSMWLEGDRFMVDLHDQGEQFDPNMVADPALGTAQERGYGLFLLHELMDIVIYTPVNGGNQWHLEKRLI